MATYEAVSVKSATLSGTTQDVVTITGFAPAIEVYNRDADEDLWFIVSDEDPGAIEAEGDGVSYIPPLSSTVVAAGRATCVVRLLGASNAYTVTALIREGMMRITPHNALPGRGVAEAHDATVVSFDSGEGIAATDVAGALDELKATIGALDAGDIAVTKPVGMPGTITTVQATLDAIWAALEPLLSS